MSFQRSKILGVFVLSACLGGCVTSTTERTPRQVSDSPWLEPSPVLADQIDDQAKRLPWTHGVERVEMIAWFSRAGEPAYGKLLQLACDPSPDVAGSALAALGATGDKRLVEPLRDLPWPKPLDPMIEFERARTLTRLGDWSEVRVLIRGLSSSEVLTRTLCAQALNDATGEKFGYDPHANELEREAAAKKWSEWLSRREGEGILAKNP
ncbi:MAG: hypothetical protein K8S98_04700 [Planctomycetes bacterium]|nr:hypothetical protein [Planctomycetota bacterium]